MSDETYKLNTVQKIGFVVAAFGIGMLATIELMPTREQTPDIVITSSTEEHEFSFIDSYNDQVREKINAANR